MLTTQNSSIQDKNNSQMWTRFFHNRLAIKIKSQRKQRSRNTGH